MRGGLSACAGLLAALLLLSGCGSVGGDDVGGGVTVSVSFKETVPESEDIPLSDRLTVMLPVFEALVRTIEYESTAEKRGSYRPDDPAFVSAALRRLVFLDHERAGLAASGGSVDISAELLRGYADACFGAEVPLPDALKDGSKVSLTAKDVVSDAKKSIELADVTDNGDLTFTAYVNFRSVADSSIISMYIVKLAEDYGGVFGFRVESCLIFE